MISFICCHYRNRKLRQLIIVIALTTSIIITLQLIYCLVPCCQQQRIPDKRLPTIYVITPTYDRYVQAAELTRLSHTFMLVPNLHWIIVEDSELPTARVEKFAERLRAKHNFKLVTCLQAQTPPAYKWRPGQPSWQHPKGVWQRNKALWWLRENINNLDNNGVVYFADDDNTYDLELFEEMRDTRRVSVWPVGLVGGLLAERPLIGGGDGNNKGTRVVGFNSRWANKRPYPVDMAGFAISLRLIIAHSGASFSAKQKIGYLESHFLGQLISSWDELEPKANNCTRVLVWHTKTQAPNLSEERKLNSSSLAGLEE